jgi:pimeloyl-ACP methyl ester carboxylesterase
VLVGPTTDPRSPTWPGLVRRWLATARRESPGQVPVLLRDYRRTTLRSMRRGMEAARHDRVDATLADVRVPVLVARGAHDRICPPDWAALLAGVAGPGSRAVSLGAGAHMVPLTHGPALAEPVRLFLAGRG